MAVNHFKYLAGRYELCVKSMKNKGWMGILHWEREKESIGSEFLKLFTFRFEWGSGILALFFGGHVEILWVKFLSEKYTCEDPASVHVSLFKRNISWFFLIICLNCLQRSDSLILLDLCSVNMLDLIDCLVQ